MEEENLKQQYSMRESNTGWNESHPWLAGSVAAEDDDVDEVIRYTLDEIRFAYASEELIPEYAYQKGAPIRTRLLAWLFTLLSPCSSVWQRRHRRS